MSQVPTRAVAGFGRRIPRVQRVAGQVPQLRHHPVLPCARDRAVTQEQVTARPAGNPRRFFEAGCPARRAAGQRVAVA